MALNSCSVSVVVEDGGENSIEKKMIDKLVNFSFRLNGEMVDVELMVEVDAHGNVLSFLSEGDVRFLSAWTCEIHQALRQVIGDVVDMVVYGSHRDGRHLVGYAGSDDTFPYDEPSAIDASGEWIQGYVHLDKDSLNQALKSGAITARINGDRLVLARNSSADDSKKKFSETDSYILRG